MTGFFLLSNRCSVCLKTFARKEHLDNHFRSHSGESPFRCQVGQTFSIQKPRHFLKDSPSLVDMSFRTFGCAVLSNMEISNFSFVQRPSQGRNICKTTKESTLLQHRDVISAINRSQGRSITSIIHYGTTERLHINVRYATRNTHEKNILPTICVRTPWLVVYFKFVIWIGHFKIHRLF